MRIIAGEHRGRRLKAPSGQGTRPTVDRVRESLMSALVSARGGLDGAVVLDAFAGSGALGLEAMSRGAASACFFDLSREANAVVRDNVQMLGYDMRRARVRCADVLKSPPVLARPPFDVVFLDPPYDFAPDAVLALIPTLAAAGALADDALVTYEHGKSADAAVDAAIETHGLGLRSRRVYGKTVVDILETRRPAS